MVEFCDFYADDDHHFVGARVLVTNVGYSNYLEYLQVAQFVFNGLPARDPEDKLWRGVFGYLSWGIKTEIGSEIRFDTPVYLNWYNNYIEPPFAYYDVVRIWMRKGTLATTHLFQSNPLEVGAQVLNPGVILN